MGAPSQWRVIYISEVDLSRDDGPGINEREFVQACLRKYPDRIRYVVPEPSRPTAFHHPEVEYVRAHADSPFLYALHLRSAYAKVLELVDREPIDALVFRLGASPVLPWILSRATGLPVLLKTLILYSLFGQHSARGRAKNTLSRLFRPMFRSVLTGALAVDTPTATYAAWHAEHFGVDPGRMTIIPNGANPDQFRPADQEEARHRLGLDRFDRLIGYVGAFSRNRNVDTLIEAFAASRFGPSTGLVLVGAGPDRDHLEALARSLGVAERVVFVGSVPYGDVPDYLAALDVAIDLTALEMQVAGQGQLTSFSQKIPQYLLCGVPVVVCECDGTEFVEVEGLGACVPHGDVEGLAAALQRVIDENPVEARATRERCRRVALARLSAEAVHAQRVAWWDRALSGGVAPSE